MLLENSFVSAGAFLVDGQAVKNRKVLTGCSCYIAVKNVQTYFSHLHKILT